MSSTAPPRGRCSAWSVRSSPPTATWTSRCSSSGGAPSPHLARLHVVSTEERHLVLWSGLPDHPEMKVVSEVRGRQHTATFHSSYCMDSSCSRLFACQVPSMVATSPGLTRIHRHQVPPHQEGLGGLLQHPRLPPAPHAQPHLRGVVRRRGGCTCAGMWWPPPPPASPWSLPLMAA